MKNIPDISYVSSIAGHSSYSTTVNVYGHPTNNNQYFDMSAMIQEVMQ